MVTITAIETFDVRFPTSEGLHGSDAVHPDPDYSCAYLVLKTDGQHEGHGLTFTIGRGTEVVKAAIEAYTHLVVNQTLEHITSNFGQFWQSLVNDGQLRWLGPEKGVVHIACGAIVNAIWDLWAKTENKPVWRLVAEMSPEQIVSLIDFRWITDALTPEEALEILRSKQATKQERIDTLLKSGYRAYTTSAGWLGYTEAELRQKCRAGVAEGWSHFKAKVGVNVKEDRERLAVIRSEIGYDRTLMVDANQRWSVPEAIEYMKQLADFKPYFIEEPTASDDVLGHLAIKQALAPYGIKVATGEVCHNRVMFKQFIMSGAMDVCQIDSCRIAGVNELLSVMLIAAKYKVDIWPHAGGVGLCEMVQSLAMIDYIAISGKMQVIEYVNHLHEHFKYPVVVKDGCYFPPLDPGYATEMYERSLRDFAFPYGKEWVDRLNRGVSRSNVTPMARTHKQFSNSLVRSPANQQRSGPVWLVTGGQGFVGAWLIKALLAHPSQPRVVCHDLQHNDSLLTQVLSSEELQSIDRVYADITDTEAITRLVLDVKPQFVCHLVGVQIPTCRANPALGAKVNVGGTVNIFEACVQAKNAGFPVQSIVYASSAAALGPAEDYGGDDVFVPEIFNHQPRTQYGVFKLCNEGNARMYALDHGIPSVGLRPLTVFGVGREIGMTSAPVKAVKNAIMNKTPFEIPFNGHTSFVDVRSLADLFIQSALKCTQGAHVCAVAGHRASVEEFMKAAENELSELSGNWKIAANAQPLPFPSHFDDANLTKLLGAPYKSAPLSEGIREMVQHFKSLHSAGRLHGEDLK